MDLAAIHAFVAVARSGGFAAAGRHLRVPRSTLSRQIQRLEEELGVRLMERTTRRVRLTEAGEAYLHRCAHALNLIDAANDGAREAAAQPRGTLRVTAPIDVARDVLAGMLPEFRRRYPDIELDLDVTQRLVDIVAEGFDVALRGGERLRDSSLVGRRLGPHAFGLFASPAYLAARGVPETPRDLDRHDLIALTTPDGPVPWRLVGPAGAVDIAPRAWLRANELGLVRAAIAAGLGIGLAEPITSSRDLREGRIQQVLADYTLPGGVLYAVYPGARRVPPKVRVFVDLLAEHVRAMGWRGR
ncbi:MAG TPA: LysR family transcriptional regulator [Candidatus Acidoferrum sp.]|nr:LysR family transcriptional regulator [Candidatus Acidoferrum sp.]